MLKGRSKSIIVSLTALVVALGGAGIAATGGNFILGQGNTATTRSVLSASVTSEALLVRNLNTAAGAAALRLHTSATNAPLEVTSTVRVAKLNADMVDGKHASAFAAAASEGWHYVGATGEPGFLNEWENFSQPPFQDAAFRIDQNGVVHLTGLITGGDLDLPAFRLSGQYCPYYIHPFLVLSDDGSPRPSSLIGRVDVFFEEGDGCNVRITEGDPTQFVSLEGISYRTQALDDNVAAPPPGP